MSDHPWTVEQFRPKLDEFLKPLLRLSRLDLDYELREGGGDDKFISTDITVSFDGKDLDLLLAQRGELLLALEQLTLEAIGVSHSNRYRIIFDARDYRLMRIEELRLSAQTAADNVKRTGVAFRFNAMSSRERRIIHLALRDDPEVTTLSDGVPPNSHAVVRKAET